MNPPGDIQTKDTAVASFELTEEHKCMINDMTNQYMTHLQPTFRTNVEDFYN